MIPPLFQTFILPILVHKTLQKDLEKCKGNYEEIDFKHCMKKYAKGGDRITKNWSVRFLSHHDFEIINQIEREFESKFWEELEVA